MAATSSLTSSIQHPSLRAQRAELARSLALVTNAAGFMTADALVALLPAFLDEVREYLAAEALADRGTHAADTDPPPAPHTKPCARCKGAGFVEGGSNALDFRETMTCPVCFGQGCV
jgi:hypothetical protein